MDKNDLSIEKREPGFFASLFGAEPETVLINSDGEVVAKVETEKPGLIGSLFGEEPKQVIVDNDGEKIATFKTESPGLIGSLLGEEDRTVLVDDDDEIIAEFDREEPGIVGQLFGEESKTVLLDPEGDKLASFEMEEPGIVGQLLGEKAKRLVRFDDEHVDELRAKFGMPGFNENVEARCDPERPSDADDYFVCEDEDTLMEHVDDFDEDEDEDEDFDEDDEVTYLMASGKVQVHRKSRTSSGWTITIITYESKDEYRRQQRIFKMALELVKRDR